MFITICELFNDPQYDDNDDISDETKNAVAIIQNCLEHQPTDILLGESNGVAVIKPNSVGMYDGNEVNILSVQYDKRGRLCYKIVQKLHRGSSTLVVIVEEVEKIDGKSEIGTFNEDTGEVV
jgi:hypothetical protein